MIIYIISERKIMSVCHINLLGRALDSSVKGLGFNHRPGKTYKLYSVDYNVHIRLTTSMIILSIYVFK